MSKWTRRDLLKAGIAASAGAVTVSRTAPPARAAAEPVLSPGSESTGALGASGEEGGASPGERLLLDFGWRFKLGDADDAGKDFGFGAVARERTFAKSGEVAPAAKLKYDDSGWRSVDLPHDWAVELPFNDTPVLADLGGKPLGREYPGTSVGWYRRVFDLPASDAGKRIAVEFDGVFRQALVMFNGHYIGENFSGYAPFRFDVTDFANLGERNVLAVRVDATLGEGWFYEGAGIYRHVWLTKTDPLHVAQGGTYVRSLVREGSATVSISTEVENQSAQEATCRVRSRIVDYEGKVVATVNTEPARVAPWAKTTVELRVVVDDPVLWSDEQPYLYRLVTMVENDGKTTDSVETTFGIRTIRFDAERGLFLNGKPVKIKGTCNHQDHAGVGVALPDRLQYFRIARLKEMGSNAYRTSHNPPTPELLDACDRLGMLVMDETRMMSSCPEGLSQLERLVRRDRNHPSVVIWSIGNEEPEQSTSRGARIAASMKRLVRELDPTRPITEAQNDGWGSGLSAVVDVQGFNYAGGAGPRLAEQIDDFHQRFPKQPTIGTETASTVCTRGIYANDEKRGYVSAYDLNHPPWASTAEEWWTVYAARRFLSGGFAWTGFDYRGEPTPYSWPCISSHFGIMDTCGFAKDEYFYYQAWWGLKPVLHLFPHWNWSGQEGQQIDVWCHTNLDSVELLLNGASLGSKQVKRNSHVEWKVPYAAGVLEARGTRNGGVVLIDKRMTTDQPAKLVLSVIFPEAPKRVEPGNTGGYMLVASTGDRIAADGEDVCVVTAEVLDSQGRAVPTASNLVNFALSGPGRIIGVGNGDPSCHEPDKPSSPTEARRSAFNGLCMAIVQSLKQPGEIRLSASAGGLEGISVVIQAEAATPRPAVA